MQHGLSRSKIVDAPMWYGALVGCSRSLGSRVRRQLHNRRMSLFLATTLTLITDLPLGHVKPAGALHGHVPVAVVGLGRGHRGHPLGPTGTSHTSIYRSHVSVWRHVLEAHLFGPARNPVVEGPQLSSMTLPQHRHHTLINTGTYSSTQGGGWTRMPQMRIMRVDQHL